MPKGKGYKEGSDDRKKKIARKMLGSGMAGRAADKLTGRKRRLEEALRAAGG